MEEQLSSAFAFIVLAGGAAGVLATWIKWVRPWVRRWQSDVIAGRDALVGRPPVVDSITGAELSPAIPGIGHRMATVEQTLVALAQQHHTLNQLQEGQANHEARIGRLEDAVVERVMNRADSTAAWQAMHAAVQAEPEQQSDNTP